MKSLATLREEAATCRNCDLWQHATQIVFGHGPAHAKLMLIGEQPGDREDRAGEPFVGPAGGLLERALDEAGLGRDKVYLTNAVKHFKFTTRGKRRIHDKPSAVEVKSCRPWVEEEIEIVKPEVIVLLGATAGQALLGKAFRVTQSRGQWIESTLAPKVTATLHPAAILRIPDEKTRHQEVARFCADIALAASALGVTPR